VLEADVEVNRRDFTVRAEINVGPGERLALFGPSGAGKTTLLEAIAGLVPLRRGGIVLGGRVLTATAARPRIAVPPAKRKVGLLRQDPGLFPHMSVRANLTYARSARPTETELTWTADALGISELLSEMPARLSGGQAHRVALGRLLLAHCDVLLLDEPYTGLDARLRRSLTELVVSVVGQRRIPAVLVTHELPDAQAFADRLAVLDRGRLLQDGKPDEVVLAPASRRIAELVGYLGFLPVRPAAGGTGSLPLTAGIHPDRVVRAAFPDRGLVVAGTVVGARPAGAAWEVDLQADGSQITFRLTELPPALGTNLAVTAIEPPCFGPDGLAVPAEAAGRPWLAQAPAERSGGSSPRTSEARQAHD
jgi:ABC-type sulfate/molybdate transport systems ATPase subunit